MKASIQGVCMEVFSKEKDGKKVNYALLFQPGETELLKVKLVNGDVPAEGEKVYFSGRVVAWKWRDNVNMMFVQEQNEG